MKKNWRKYSAILLGLLAAIVMVSQYQNCGSSSPGGSSTGGTGTGLTIGSTTATGPSGYSYSVTLSPSNTEPAVSTVISVAATITVSTSENLQVNMGYINSNGTKVQGCVVYPTGTSSTLSCNITSPSTAGVVYLYADVFDQSSQQQELACDSGATTVAGCNGSFAIDVGGVSTAETDYSVAINSGGPGYAGPSGMTWDSDQYYSGGTGVRNSETVSNAPDGDAEVYSSNRNGNFTYTIPVANGSHTVVLKFAEFYWGASNERLFNIIINGTTVLSSFDIYANAGGKYLAVDESFPVNVTNGYVTIVAQTVRDNAQINGVVIY